MDTSLPPTASGPTANSPSDLSYSSGASSHTSSPNTSPDSATAVSRHSSPFLDLLNLNTRIEHTPNTLLDPQTKMERNPFQSVNDRRNKLVTDRSQVSQFQQPQLQPQPQPATLRSGIQPPNPPRGLASSNWRTHPIDEMGPQARNIFNPFDATSGHHLQQQGPLRNTTYAVPRLEQHPHSSMAGYPNIAIFSDAQLDSSYAYCYDRGNGQYTRLIPADMLPPLRDIPALQQGCSSMIVLPQPQALPPNGRSSNTEPTVLRSPPVTPTTPPDTIQSRIDNIVASTPPTPTAAGPGPNIGVGSGVGGSGQHHGHGHGHGHGPHQHQHQNQRRPKIYCDKWVHEGVCAFTQQGCKYKHEMPYDKVTQHQLGLFHGFPAWWKKHQAELARQREGPFDSGGGAGSGAGRSGAGAGAGVGASAAPEEARSSRERFLARGGGHPIAAAADVSGGGTGAGAYHSAGGSSRAVPSAGEMASQGGAGGMSAATGAQLTWRRSGANSPEQVLGGTPSPAARGSIARGMGPTSLRNPTVTYASPFGPIGPPSRASAVPASTAATVSSSFLGQSQNEIPALGPRAGVSAIMAPASNPFSALGALDDENAADEKASASASHSATGSGSTGARLA
ncbi:hypothetical protein F4779DRAFT_634270 [Xylariaceae sp. FL0662B]|nr:hypothetical protein F4779DRAFT_634270 [Xylariaceae sp. FL0662B]